MIKSYLKFQKKKNLPVVKIEWNKPTEKENNQNVHGGVWKPEKLLFGTSVIFTSHQILQ